MYNHTVSPPENGKLDREFMAHALIQARLALKRGEIPVGAVVVSPDGNMIARAHNSPRKMNDPTAHAEILALRQAGEVMGNYRLNEYTLYVTIEPCLMCAGALIQARLGRLVYGAPDPKGGAVHSLYNALSDPRLNHRMEVSGGVLEKECAGVIASFFKSKRRQKRRGTEVVVTGTTRNRLVP